MSSTDSHVADTKLVRKKIQRHCKRKLSLLITERELRDPKLGDLQLMGVQFKDRNQLERALKRLHLNGDLVPLGSCIRGPDGEEVEVQEKRPKGKEEEIQATGKATGEATGEAPGQTAIRGATPCSDVDGYAIYRMQDLVGGRPSRADPVYVAGFTLESIADELMETLSKETGQRIHRENKCLVPVEALRSVYNTAIRDSFTRVRVHLYLTSRGLLQSIPCPGRPNAIRTNESDERFPIADDLKLFRLGTDVVYVQSEMERRNIHFNYKSLDYGSQVGDAEQQYNNPEEIARVAQLTDKELKERLKELYGEIKMTNWKPYSVDAGRVDRELLHEIFSPNLSSCADIKLIRAMFSSDSPYIQQLSNLYRLVQSVVVSDPLRHMRDLTDTASSLVPAGSGPAGVGNDLCDIKRTYRAVNLLVRWIEYSLLLDVVKPWDSSFINNVTGIGAKSAGIFNLTVAIHRLSSILSKSSPDLNNLQQISSLVLGSPGLADLPTARQARGIYASIGAQRDVLKDPLHPHRHNPAYFILRELANLAIIVYVLANLALAHPNLVYTPLVNFGLETPGLDKFLSANPELAHPSMARFVESNPVVVNTCLAMHIIANLIMTYPSLTEIFIDTCDSDKESDDSCMESADSCMDSAESQPDDMIE